MPNATEKSSSSQNPAETLSNGNKENQRPKRTRTEMIRYGQRENEVNDDALFDEADELAAGRITSVSDCDLTTTSISSPTSDSHDLSGMSPGELIIYKKVCRLEQILNRIDSRITNIEVRVQHSKQALQKPDREMMLECGFPLANKSKLDDFEFNLLSLEYETQVVSLLIASSYDVIRIFLKEPNEF